SAQSYSNAALGGETARSSTRGGCGRTLGFGRESGTADQRYQHLCIGQEAIRGAFHVFRRDRLDQTVAPVDVVDAEILTLDFEQLARDLARQSESERERADQITLGLRQFVGRRTLGG